MNNDDRFVTQSANNANSQNNTGVGPTITKATIVSSSSVGNNHATTDTSMPQVGSVQDVPVTPKIPVENATPQVTTESTTSLNDQQVNNDTGMVTDENLKKVEINYTPPSKFKIFVLFVFFIGMVAFVIFLPDITAYINKLKSGELNYQEEKITTGRLKCSLSTNTTNLDKKYDINFKFTDNKLEKVEFTITTRGDITLDEDALDKLAATCKTLKENTKGLNGVYISCNYSDGELVEIQNFDLAEVNMEKLDSAYTEAGGNNPEYQNGQDVDTIERNLNASGYSCKREK